MPELTYAAAKKEDAPVIFELCKNLIDAYEDLTSIDYESVLQWVEKKIATNISAYTCVYRDTQKVGYYSLTCSENGWELDDFYVLEQYRGCGIGTKILEKCLQDAKGPVFLYVFRKNLGAIRLYERHGFSVKEQVGKTRLIMRREG